MEKILSSIQWIILAITSPLAIILGAIFNPSGAVNGFLCRIIDLIAVPWPSTPDNLKIYNLLASIGDAIPLVGKAVVYDIFSTAISFLTIVLLIKVYKLIPFKAT